MRRRLFLGACASLLANGACSFIAVRPTPRHPGTKTPECSSALAPIVDVAGAAGLGLGAALLDAVVHAAEECSRYPNEHQCGTHLWFYVPAAVLGASAIYGFWAIAHCSSQLDKDELPADLAALDHAIEARCGAQSERPKDGVAASGRLSACGH